MNNNYLNESIYPWLSDHGVTILIIIIGMWAIRTFAWFLIEKVIRKTVTDKAGYLSKEAEEKRENTLIKVFSGTVAILIWIIGGMMVLSEFGVDIGPMLAAAGVAGLAFGFGGQYLIRDIISGLFIIFENQYRVGDVIKIGEVAGTVESINLRLTIIRDLDGAVHHIPNGEIGVASNLTKFYSRVNLDMGVSYDADLEKVIEITNKVGDELANDPEWEKMITKAPQFLRVNDFADSAVMIKILGETTPADRWAVMGELRKRLKIAYDKAGIEIPFPQRVIHNFKR